MWHAQRCIYYIWGVHSFHLTMNNSCPAVGQLSLSATGAASAAAAASRASAVHLLVNIFISVALWADSVTLPPRHCRRVWGRERGRDQDWTWVECPVLQGQWQEQLLEAQLKRQQQREEQQQMRLWQVHTKPFPSLSLYPPPTMLAYAALSSMSTSLRRPRDAIVVCIKLQFTIMTIKRSREKDKKKEKDSKRKRRQNALEFWRIKQKIW